MLFYRDIRQKLKQEILEIQGKYPDFKPGLAIVQVNELRHEISNNVVCATSKSSDQPTHTRRLIRAFASCLNIL